MNQYHYEVGDIVRLKKGLAKPDKTWYHLFSVYKLFLAHRQSLWARDQKEVKSHEQI